jgi:Family of unknown function (DUF6356)
MFFRILLLPHRLLKWFTKHPNEHQMTYLQHLLRAWGLAYHMGKGSIALLIHGICPEWFTTTGTDTIRSIHQSLAKKE